MSVLFRDEGGTTAATDTGTVAWVDGRIVAGEPAIRPDDRGLWGDGVFEALKVIDGVPFALRRHLDRLVASAGPIGLVFDVDAVRAAIDGVLPSAAGLPSPCWLRVTVTAGPARMAAGDRPTVPTIIAAVAPLARWRPVTDVIVLPWRRNEHGALAGLKTISYLENGVGLRHARDRGANRLTAFTVGADGGLDDRRTFAEIGGFFPDGIALDADGAVWAADPVGRRVVRVREGGTVTDELSTAPNGAFACALGGADGRTLFVCLYDERSTMVADGAPASGSIVATTVTVPAA